MQGQRFNIDLDAENENDNIGLPNFDQITNFNIGLVGDIKERETSSSVKAPSLPRLKSSGTGFPAHRIRTGPSNFKKRNESKKTERECINGPGGPKKAQPIQGQSKKLDSDSSVVPERNGEERPIPGLDGSSIDQENKQRLAEMSEEEIEEARRELMNGLSPSLIEKLLKKANIDEGNPDSIGEPPSLADGTSRSSQMSHNEELSTKSGRLPPIAIHDTGEAPSFDPDGPPLVTPSDIHPATSFPSSLPPPPQIHFPSPPKAPELDPTDPNFLSALHSTYFPTLPADPSATSWMTTLDKKAEEESVYSTQQTAFPPSALRFDFRGHLLPPLLSSQISTTKGLHHHAHAPASAGYTIPELAHLARSSYPAQRCIAYQTLGRMLYRLGRGDFGQEGEDLCEGLWQLMEKGKVVQQLVEAAANQDKGSKSVWATATDAVWLWRKGGGRRWKGR